MGIFDGVLLATDLDGTLASGTDINPSDVQAIEYFKREGGLFTIATGRVDGYLIKNILTKISPNAPVITLNGSVICNSDCSEILKRYFIRNFKCRLDFILNYKEYIDEFYVYYKDRSSAVTVLPRDYLEGRMNFDDDSEIHKIVFSFNSEDKAIEAMNKSNLLFFFDKNVSLRSWGTGLELLAKSNTKDKAVMEVKKMVGAKILVCAGDFENDIPMIKIADIGYAVGNALDSVKASADRITVPRSECAIASIIKELPTLL